MLRSVRNGFSTLGVACLFQLSSIAQTTFNVDMTCAPEGFENVFVTGPWCGWAANDTYNTMTDPDGDGIYTVEVADLTGTVEYKYAINGFADQENLVNDMEDGASCAPVTDYSAYANRQTEAGSTTNDYYGTCDGTCNDVSGTVTFQVDMAGYAGTFGTVNLNGSFNGWCGVCATMLDDDGDGVYTLDVALPGGTVEYKFTVDGWTDQEMFAEGTSCTSTMAGYTNRTLDVMGDQVLDVVCWNSCAACGVSPYGCTDPAATNYDATATEDDGSCVYEVTGTLLFVETFSNGFAGDNGYGGWTVEDTGGNQIWVAVGPDGFGTYADGSATNAVHPAGEFSTNYGPLESTSASNGWVVFDNDFYNTPISDGYEDTEGTLTSPVLNFTGIGSVIVNWQSYFRYCCYPYAPYYLEVGVTENGITTWTSFDAHGDFIESANTFSINPLQVSVDISCVAANQPAVQFRFAHRQAPETGTGYSHYFWGIDDVSVSTNDVLNDLEIVQIVNGDVWNVFEYRSTPLEQAIPESEGGLLAGVMYRNAGLANQNNVTVEVNVLDEFGNTLSTATEALGTVPSFANALQCPPNLQDTLYIATGWEPTSVGTYTLRIALTSDQNDATPENNVMAKDILYTEDIYGHDDENVLEGELRPRESDDIPELFDPTGYGSYYHCPNPGSMAHGLAVRFGPNCGLDINGNVEDLEFETRLYSYDSSTGLTDSPFDVAHWIFDADWRNLEGTSDIEVYFAFDEPIEMTEGPFYFAAVISEYHSPSELTVLSQPNSDTDNSTGQYTQSGAGSFVWFTNQTSTPAIRVVTGPRGCEDPLACNYQSGGAFVMSAEVICEYTSCLGCTDTTACNFDAGASQDDGSCDYSCYGCTDEEAFNWDPEATLDDGSCVYFLTTCDFLGFPEWNSLEAGLYSDTLMWHHTGTQAAGSFVLSMPLTVQEPSSGTSFAVHAWYDLSLSNLPPGFEAMDMPTSLGGGEQACVSYEGVTSEAGTYPLLVSGQLEVLLFGNPYLIGVYNVVGSMEILPNPNPIPGCTYSGAENWVIYATTDDGSCVFAGCTDPAALNYHPVFTTDDGSCLFGDLSSSCPSDVDEDGAVGTSDLLLMLSNFGLPCD